MSFKPAVPKDAAAVILLDQDLEKVLWAQRNPKIPFLGGFHAFPGGKTDPGDSAIAVRNCAPEEAPFIVSCARETFEEVGVLIVRNGERLTRGQRASLHDDLISGRATFAEILDAWGLWLDADDFLDTGHWTTPPFSPVRFKTRFYLAVCPPKQTPYQAITEMLDPEFVAPADALARWERAEALMSPPVLIGLQEIARFKRGDGEPDAESLKRLAAVLLEKSRSCDGNIDHVELNPRVICIPLRTETLPPATHTNCFVVGRREFIVIDAATRDDEELEKLYRLTDALVEAGGVCRAIVVTHLHKDHFGGETRLQARFRDKFGMDAPLAAHADTIASLAGKIEFGKSVEDEEIFALSDAAGRGFGLRALVAPGHARGHLNFYDEERGFLLSSDNVVGAGTVVIAPPEGDMRDYLATLARLRALPNLRSLCGSHGTAIYDAKAKIDEYVAHRLERERQIVEAIAGGASTPDEIAAVVYRDLRPEAMPLAVKSVAAHLAKIKADSAEA